MLDIIGKITLPILTGPFGIVVVCIGFIGTGVMLFWVPIRLIWIVISHFIKKDRDRSFYTVSIIFLLLSIYPLVEFFLKAENGTSGLFLIALTPVPFILYLISEYFRFIAFSNKYLI